MTLTEFFQANPKVALAFSGGTDSAFLLYAAKQCGCAVTPYFVHTPFQPQFELDDAQNLCRQLGIALTVIEHDILSHPEVSCNPSDRCYHCKKTLFALLIERARAEGSPIVIDGTNASDDADDRPGMRALQELGVVSPLRLCGITKPEVRRRSKEAGLFTHSKPSYACLATRIPTGKTIEHEMLRRVEAAESRLFAEGFSDFRIRVLDSTALLQVPAQQWQRVCDQRQELVQKLRQWFDAVALDLRPRDE